VVGSFSGGFFMNVINPKVALFFLPSCCSSFRESWNATADAAWIHFHGEQLSCSASACSRSGTRPQEAANRKVFARLSAGVFASLGIRLVLAEGKVRRGNLFKP
jgi:threonine/homoserine/homoserine lactone efflux protein